LRSHQVLGVARQDPAERRLNRDLSRVPPPNRLDPRRAPSFVTGYFDYKLNKRLKLEAYYLKGLTVQSPDRGAGISLALDF
jgi:hypothetical protein